MNTIYFDAASGVSGDMILASLLDLGVEPSRFVNAMKELGLPAEIDIYETRRMSLRGVKVDVKINRESISRKWADIKRLIENSPFSEAVKKSALDIFRNLFQAEARVHGSDFDSVHLHEAGADDAIIDIAGASFLLEELRVSSILCSPLNLGGGWVKSKHGQMPVPPPAVGELLKGVPVFSAHADKELVTPTGAAVITTLSERFCSFPELCYSAVGYGAGSRDIPDFPNILRAFYGEEKENRFRAVFQLEANIDDSNPQILAAFVDKALQQGALEVFLTPVVMKKNRLGSKLTLLAEKDKIDKLAGLVFRETSSIGIRYFPVERQVLRRDQTTVEILGETLSIKVSYHKGSPIHAQPEFSDCLRTAEKTGVPLKDVMRLALQEYMNRRSRKT